MRSDPTPRWLATFAGLIVVAACAREGPGALSGSSVLLVTLDTTRADAIGCYGGPDWATPHIDRLAREGARFDQARTTVPVTLPAHSSILTGLMPFEHGVRDNSTFRLPGGVTTLAERMSAAGYSTGAVTGAFVLHSEFGLDQGFDVYSDVPRRKLEMDIVEDQRSADEVVDEALRLLEQGLVEPPFFLWVHLFDPHRPLDPPEEYRRRALEGASPELTPFAELERRVYHAEVAFADAQIGRLLARLEHWLPPDELLVAVVADHGEGFGDHGEPAHGLQLFDTTMRVPMVVHHPDLPAGVVVAHPVSTADLAPTFLALLGIDAAGMTARDRSPLLYGRDAPPDDGVYLETCHPYFTYGWSPLFGVVEGRTKVVEGPVPAVYDLAHDPREATNLAGDRDADYRRAKETFAALAPRTASSERIELQDDDRLALQQLGYAGDAADGGGSAPLPPGWRDPTLPDPGAGMEIKILCQEAVSHLYGGDHDLAVQGIEQVLRLDPNNPFFLSQAGTIYITVGRPAEAIAPLKRSVELSEGASARCSLAIAYNLSGNKQKAIEILGLNAQLHPNHLHTRFALGEMLLETGRPAEALEQFEAFLERHVADDAWHQTATTLAGRARQRAEGERR